VVRMLQALQLRLSTSFLHLPGDGWVFTDRSTDANPDFVMLFCLLLIQLILQCSAGIGITLGHYRWLIKHMGWSVRMQRNLQARTGNSA